LHNISSSARIPTTAAGLVKLREAGHQPVAFSNGVEATLRNLLHHAGILAHLAGIMSVDDLKTFKPDPLVFVYLAQQLHPQPTIHGSYRVILSRNRGKVGRPEGSLDKTKDDSVFDPWDIHPDLIASDLIGFRQTHGGVLFLT
jgi:2-haloacid dehalogenase